MPTETDITIFENAYTPSSILGIYANFIKTPIETRQIIIRGIVQIQQNQKNYGGYFYDYLKSVDENKAIRIKVPETLRASLIDNNVYVLKGYIEKKINFSTIELVFALIEVLKLEENVLDDIELERIKLVRTKAKAGFKNFESIIKQHVYENQRIKIANIYGETAIVDKDFEKAVSEAISRFEIKTFRCNLNSKDKIIETLKKMKGLDVDVIAIVRGGGETISMEVLNDPGIGVELIGSQKVMVTALGHVVNESLLDRLADWKFELPYDYGIKLKTWVDEATEEMEKSKSRFMEQVKKDLTKTFQDQITTLQVQLSTKNKEFETAQAEFKRVTEQYQKEKNETIQAKVNEYAAGLKVLQEQLKAKDENIKQQISVATAEIRAKLEVVSSENNRLSRKERELESANSNKKWYIIAGIIIGIILAMMLLK